MTEQLYQVIFTSGGNGYGGRDRDIIAVCYGDPEDIRRYYQSTREDGEIKVYPITPQIIGPDKRKRELEVEKENLLKQIAELDEKLEYS